jgi:hypothetical protein
MRYLLTVGFVTLALPFVAAEPPEKELETAKTAFQKSASEAREALLTGFGKAEVVVRNRTGITGAARLELLKLLRDEMGEFKEMGKLPISAEMKFYVREYAESVIRAETALGRAYDKAIDVLTKKGETKAASELVAEWKAAIEESDRRWAKAMFSALLGSWAVEIPDAGGYKSTWTFAEDGTVTASAGGSLAARWVVDRNRRRIVMLWDDGKSWDSFNLPLNLNGTTMGDSWTKKKVYAVKLK